MKAKNKKQTRTVYVTTFDSVQKAYNELNGIATKENPVILVCESKGEKIECAGPWRAENPTQSK